MSLCKEDQARRDSFIVSNFTTRQRLVVKRAGKNLLSTIFSPSICLTVARIRRVKCDEARPSCQRCLKFGLGCDGYEDNGEGRKPSHDQAPGNGPALIFAKRQAVYTCVCRSPQRSMFRKYQEYRYFKVFSIQTASQLTGLFASNLWNRLVL